MSTQQREGPETRDIPSQRIRVCGDCKYHKVVRFMCGSREVTDNYSCTHPDNGPLHSIGGILGEGRSIAWNSSKTPATPEWCPFLNPWKKDEGK